MINDAFSFRNVTKKRFSIFLTYMYQRTCVLIAIRTLYNYLFFAWGRLFRYYVSSCLIFCNLFVTIHSPASPFVLSQNALYIKSHSQFYFTSLTELQKMANFGLHEAILMLLFTVAATYTDVVRDSIILKQFEGQPRSQAWFVVYIVKINILDNFFSR